ncbi:MAG TPA: PorP/SprF family type IX secretion system membrane protein [Eudoraea sp.]|nr:PorP/SprF family type IX secretion system membrane protein [Eudoraea sp.]
MRSTFLFCWLLLGVLANAQRVVVPDQELLYPFLNDPSYIGEGQRVQLTGLLQLSNSEMQHTTKWLNAQVALYDNVAFGLDYFNDSFDFYDYSTIMFSTAFKIGLGDYNHYIKIGLSGGGESRKQDSRPLSMIPPGQTYVEDVTNNNIELTYKAGIHYRYKNATLGGYYIRMPLQNITLENQNELLHYSIEEGFTGYLLYNFRVADRVRITPVFRYLSYLEDALYEGAVKVNFADRVEASIAYRNDYSINPAIRFRVIKALDIGYSYEKALGSAEFQDVHGISASYKFFKADEEEPEWLRNARDNIDQVSQIKKRAPKKEQTQQPEEVQEPEVTPLEEAEPEQPVVADAPVQEEAREAIPVERVEEDKPKTTLETGMLESGYYIVVGSFSTEAEARSYMDQLDRTVYFPRMGRKEADGPLHVYIDSDYDREEAMKRLRAHKLDRNFRNAILVEVE